MCDGSTLDGPPDREEVDAADPAAEAEDDLAVPFSPPPLGRARTRGRGRLSSSQRRLRQLISHKGKPASNKWVAEEDISSPS